MICLRLFGSFFFCCIIVSPELSYNHSPVSNFIMFHLTVLRVAVIPITDLDERSDDQEG